MTSRISSELYHAIQLYAQQNTAQSRSRSQDTAAVTDLPTDKVELSPQAVELAKDLAVAAKIVKEADTAALSAQHKARIDGLARRMREGTYTVPSGDIAERLAPALRALDQGQG